MCLYGQLLVIDGDKVRVCLADAQFTIQSIWSALNCLVALTPFKSDYSRKNQWCLAVTTRLSSSAFTVCYKTYSESLMCILCQVYNRYQMSECLN